MRGMVILVAMLFFAIVLRRRPASLVLTAMLLWIFIPYVAIAVVWGEFPAPILGKIHPATMLMLVALYVVVLDTMSGMSRHILRSGGSYFVLGTFLIAVTIEFIFVASSGFGIIVNQIVGPLIAYLLLRYEISYNPAARKTVIYGVISAAAVQSALVVIQSMIGRMVPYEHYYFAQYWFRLAHDRWFGTLDHPLVFGLLLASATFLLAEIPSIVLRFGLAGTFMIGILISQSRAALIVCTLGLVFLILRSSARPLQRSVLVLLATLTSIVMWSAFASSSTYSRFADDAGSTGMRRAAAEEFLSQGFQNLMHGGGSGYSYSFYANRQLTSSFENPFMMYSLDFGLVPTMLYFGAMIWLVLTAARLRERRDINLAAAAAIVLVLSFSSIATEGASAFILWVILGLLPEKPGGHVPVDQRRILPQDLRQVV